MALLTWFIEKRVLKPDVCLRARKSGRLQAESRRQRPGKMRISMKALRIGKEAVASYDYVVVAVHDGELIFWTTPIRRILSYPFSIPTQSAI